MLIWCKLLWLHLRSGASRAKWLHIIGQQVLQYTGVFPEGSTWKLLNSMNSIRATGICLFKKSLDRQNIFKLHTYNNSFSVIFDFFKVHSSLKVHETSHTNFILVSFPSWGGKKEVKTSPPIPKHKYSSLLVYACTETNTFHKMKAILKNSLEEITATQGSYYLYSQLHQSLIFIATVFFLFWYHKNVPCGFSVNNICAYTKTAWEKEMVADQCCK